ncbi:MAG: GDP-fucose synthetase [Candidatus Magasanikbacteria bacterium CG1_02_32_51]|uniref:GDP-L-fucose synthase n=2 Tax=Candidatus Magasanikiibacteriota TaxID=1752731 RepID=A0A1J4UBJ8_9BACT|nr:MAG: GDP-fucose synthetase [Candidatus Magasanikbacteria bacterium CG1_02_32_51]
MDYSSKIYIAGHNGMVGSAIFRLLKKQGYTNLLTRTHQELDLLDAKAVADFFVSEKPEYVILAAAKVGGILANNIYPADFLYQNLQIQSNVIHNAYLSGVKKLLFLGSSCIYPKDCPQPIKEEYLLTGLLEPTNEAYAIAKIVGIKMCQSYNRQYGTNFIAVMPTNLYGPNDNFDLENSHVLPALLRKFHEAKVNNLLEVEVWGTGRPRREFLHVDDMAKACLFVLQNFDPSKEENENGEIFFNIGTGIDLTILELAEMIRSVVGFEGKIVFDSSKPDGTMQKLLDVSKINNLGWKDEIGLKEGVKQIYEWYLNSIDT